jgi:hypothetical protein
MHKSPKAELQHGTLGRAGVLQVSKAKCCCTQVITAPSGDAKQAGTRQSQAWLAQSLLRVACNEKLPPHILDEKQDTDTARVLPWFNCALRSLGSAHANRHGSQAEATIQA